MPSSGWPRGYGCAGTACVSIYAARAPSRLSHRRWHVWGRARSAPTVGQTRLRPFPSSLLSLQTLCGLCARICVGAEVFVVVLLLVSVTFVFVTAIDIVTFAIVAIVGEEVLWKPAVRASNLNKGTRARSHFSARRVHRGEGGGERRVAESRRARTPTTLRHQLRLLRAALPSDQRVAIGQYPGYAHLCLCVAPPRRQAVRSLHSAPAPRTGLTRGGGAQRGCGVLGVRA